MSECKVRGCSIVLNVRGVSSSQSLRYVKEDSCNASEVEADREAEYSAMSAALAEAGDAINETIALSVCGWTPTYARFGAHLPPIGDSWRVGPDAGKRFM